LQYQQATGIDPHALGLQYNLGTFRKKYTRIFFLSPWWPFVIVVAFLLILIVPTVQAWLGGVVNHRLPPLEASIVIWIGMALIVLLIVVYALVPAASGIIKELRVGKLIALLYDQGFIVLTSKGNEQMVAHWPDIDVWHKVHAYIKMTIGVSLAFGYISGIPITGYRNVYTVVNRTTRESMKLLFGAKFNMVVEVEMVTCQYPSVQAAYRSGQAVNFGRLSTSSLGIYDTATNTMLTWGDVERITINEAGMVRIKQRGHPRGWASFPLGELGNVATLYRLLMADVPRSFTFQNRARIM
jgi:hypothetical protein